MRTLGAAWVGFAWCVATVLALVSARELGEVSNAVFLGCVFLFGSAAGVLFILLDRE